MHVWDMMYLLFDEVIDMAILKSGNTIRLTGEDARIYKDETGRAELPKTVAEYDRAMADTSKAWASTDCPEGNLLAAVYADIKVEPDAAQ